MSTVKFASGPVCLNAPRRPQEMTGLHVRSAGIWQICAGTVNPVFRWGVLKHSAGFGSGDPLLPGQNLSTPRSLAVPKITYPKSEFDRGFCNV